MPPRQPQPPPDSPDRDRDQTADQRTEGEGPACAGRAQEVQRSKSHCREWRVGEWQDASLLFVHRRPGHDGLCPSEVDIQIDPAARVDTRPSKQVQGPNSHNGQNSGRETDQPRVLRRLRANHCSPAPLVHENSLNTMGGSTALWRAIRGKRDVADFTIGLGTLLGSPYWRASDETPRVNGDIDRVLL